MEGVEGGAYLVNGVMVDANGTPIGGSEPAKDYASMNAPDFLAAVKAGELSKEDALKFENARSEPRKAF